MAFRFRPGTTDALIEDAGAALLTMKGLVPVIREINWARNLAPGAAEYSHVLTVLLDDMAAVERYAADPVHQRIVAEVLSPIREARLALDIEVPAHN